MHETKHVKLHPQPDKPMGDTEQRYCWRGLSLSPLEWLAELGVNFDRGGIDPAKVLISLSSKSQSRKAHMGVSVPG